MTSLFMILIGVSLAALTLSWIWYPRQMARRGRLSAPVTPSFPEQWPPVSVVLATRESTDGIVARLDNLRALDYPEDKLQFVVALDANVRDRLAEVQNMVGDRVVVVSGAAAGKSAALTAGVACAKHEYLLFVDTAQVFAADVLRLLINQVQSETWGAATATLQPTSGDGLMDQYWARELAIRVGQASRHSVICVTGCAYVMKRQYWQDMPTGLICDDLWSTYSVVTGGARVAIVTEAKVVDPRTFTREQEFGRRLRTMTGLLQFVRWFPAVTNPRRNPMWSDFLLHKLARPATPLLVILIGVSCFGLLWQRWPQVAVGLVALTALGYAVALKVAQSATGPIARLATTAIFASRLLFMPLRAIGYAAAGRWDVWRPHR